MLSSKLNNPWNVQDKACIHAWVGNPWISRSSMDTCFRLDIPWIVEIHTLTDKQPLLSFPSFPWCQIVLLMTCRDSAVWTSLTKLRRRDKTKKSRLLWSIHCVKRKPCAIHTDGIEVFWQTVARQRCALFRILERLLYSFVTKNNWS